jgi:hypothetical protein
MSELKRYQGDIKRQPKRRKFAHETSNNEIETISRDSFRVNIFLVIVDRLRAELIRLKAQCIPKLQRKIFIFDQSG